MISHMEDYGKDIKRFSLSKVSQRLIKTPPVRRNTFFCNVFEFDKQPKKKLNIENQA